MNHFAWTPPPIPLTRANAFFACPGRCIFEQPRLTQLNDKGPRIGNLTEIKRHHGELIYQLKNS